jgi:hypothetical protein
VSSTTALSALASPVDDTAVGALPWRPPALYRVCSSSWPHFHTRPASARLDVIAASVSRLRRLHPGRLEARKSQA